jgi:hypothetical protein
MKGVLITSRYRMEAKLPKQMKNKGKLSLRCD